jgi:hypothetical protein
VRGVLKNTLSPNHSLQRTGPSRRCRNRGVPRAGSLSLSLDRHAPLFMNSRDKTPNPLLATALGIIEGLAPGALSDPEKALRDLVPRLRFLVVERVERPTLPQLEALRVFDSASSLVQIRKRLQTGELCFGPLAGDLAEQAMIPRLVQQGLSVSLRELTEAEKAQHLGCEDHEKG